MFCLFLYSDLCLYPKTKGGINHNAGVFFVIYIFPGFFFPLPSISLSVKAKNEIDYIQYLLNLPLQFYNMGKPRAKPSRFAVLWWQNQQKPSAHFVFIGLPSILGLVFPRFLIVTPQLKSLIPIRSLFLKLPLKFCFLFFLFNDNFDLENPGLHS